MKLLPQHIAQQLFGSSTETKIGADDYGIKDNSEWIELPIDYSCAKTWFDDYAQRLWDNYLATLKPCLDAIYPLPTYAPTQTGMWQRWDDGIWTTIAPDDLPPCLILDTEAVQNQCVWHPICAVAFGIQDAAPKVFAWVREWSAITPNDALIPFPNNRLVVGWNVSYDRQYLASEYSVSDSGNRFLDGMGWAQSLWGISDQQLPVYKLKKYSYVPPNWVKHCTEVGLASVYRHIFNRDLDKSTRTNIEKMTWYDWMKDIDDILIYCAKDVRATQECCIDMFRRLSTEFVGSPISWIGQLEMSAPIIPLDRSWYDYLTKCQKMEHEVNRRHVAMLIELAHRKAESNDQDPRVGDWTLLKSGANKGKPKWLVEYLKNISMGKRATPILLGLQWDGKDIRWHSIDSHTGYWETVDGDKLPHPDGESKNLATPLVCDKGATYEGYVKEQRLTSTLPDFDLLQLFDELNSLTNWRAISQRCESLRIVKTKDGFITIPQVVVMGTQSRRAKDNLWLVAPKPEPRKIGSELRAMVNAPMGWRIVGADFDSEELWLASLLGDRVMWRLACCEFSRSVLLGDKAKETDLHTIMAKRNGIKRNLAKNMNFAAQYFCGAKKLAAMAVQASASYTMESAYQMSKTFLKQLRGVSTEDSKFSGGIASQVFNAMQSLADTPGARSPILSFRIPYSLDNINTRGEFLTTRSNWTIQTSGVDILHLFVTAIRQICERDNIDARLLITIHDEPRYLVRMGQERRFLFALQEAHIKTKAYAYQACEFDNMPVAVAWFSQVEYDTRLRKEVNDTCTSATNPGFRIEGKSYTPDELLEIAASATKQ